MIQKTFCFFLVCLIFVFFSCVSTSDPSLPAESQKEKSLSENEYAEPAEVWHGITSLEELRGTWISDDGYKWEYPFVLNGKTYLHRIFPEKDDTALWQECARQRNTTLDDIWGKRFSMYLEIYGVCYPYADDAQNEFGIKTYRSGGRIFCRRENLIPESVAKKNLRFFERSSKGNLRTSGPFYFTNESYGYDGSSWGFYTPYENYWY
ncbi:hypothetical protein [Treponema zioleckii]|uniref:hypothetical protein n=1 Tax=Treponema zioleckii TaxID=331680 RepID=UPI00168BA23C|nr:hypothetical protein [Treponema zioleckii]